MTIIQPHKNNYKSNFIISVLILVLISVALWGMFLYNQLVDLRHEIKKQKVSLDEAEVINAELKNKLYNIIDVENLKSSINSQSLILDKNPEYVKTAMLTMNNGR